MRFSGKVALVTGASSGLGRICALRLAAEGAQVLAVAGSADKLADVQSQAGSAIVSHACDLSVAETCRTAVDNALQHFGKLDILLNVAGVHRFRHTASITDQDWHQDLAINLNAPFFLAQAALPHLLETGGNIVNIGSLASSQGQPYSATYCAAKHGLIGLTRALALEYINTKLRVNAVCPGGMDTPQVQNIRFAEDMDFDLIMRSGSPRGFMSPEDVASTILFLASDEARAIHGAIYNVDQGRTID